MRSDSLSLIRRVGVCVTVGMLLGFGMVVALRWGTHVPSAYAASCESKTNVEAAPDSSTQHRGNRSQNLHIASPSVNCAHISSILLIVNSNNEQVEFGWSKDAPGVEDCAGTGQDQGPYIFRADVKNGTPRCFQGSDVSSGDIGADHDFRLTDGNINNEFRAYYDGTQIGTELTETFTYGVPITNGERHNSSETATADFGGLQYDTGAWHDWNSHVCYRDNNGDYSNEYAGPSHVQVTTFNGSATC